MRRQRGAALLAAMVTVTLVATLAATALWRQTQLSAMEAAERQRQQAAWVLAGALDWSRLILRSDVRNIDHLGEPWAMPLQETRLSTFLAADKSSAAHEDLARQPDVFLSGQIQDAQGRMNFANLMVNGKPVPAAVRAFERLFAQLDLPQVELARAAAQWPWTESSPSADSASRPLRPQRLSHLSTLGLSQPSLARLEAHATLLPGATRLNLNTASAQAISAVLDIPLSTASQLLRARSHEPFVDLAAAERAAGVVPGRFKAELADVKSSYFLVRGRLRLDDMAVQEQSLVKRDDSGVSIVWREKDVRQDGRPTAP